jgi:hypothetical protein
MVKMENKVKIKDLFVILKNGIGDETLALIQLLGLYATVIKFLCAAIGKLIDKKINFKVLSNDIADKKPLPIILKNFLNTTPNIPSEKIMFYVNESISIIKDLIGTIKSKPFIDIIFEIPLGPNTIGDIFNNDFISKWIVKLFSIIFKKIWNKPEFAAIRIAISEKKTLPGIIEAYVRALGNIEYENIPVLVNKTIDYILEWTSKIETESFIDLIYNIPLANKTLGTVLIPDFTPNDISDNFKLSQIIDMILK